MGSLVLMNDVETDAHAASLIADPGASLTKIGAEQCVLLSKYFYTKETKKVESIACSDTSYLRKVVHHIRSKSPHKETLRASPLYTDALKERDFGVLRGSRHPLDSSLFSHTRICAEKGESIAQCRRRLMKFVTSFCMKNPKTTILAISHSFACQIISNVILNKPHTTLSSFWMDKCSFAKFNYKTDGSVIHRWKFTHAYNVLSDRAYSEKELYRRLSEDQGTPPS